MEGGRGRLIDRQLARAGASEGPAFGPVLWRYRSSHPRQLAPRSASRSAPIVVRGTPPAPEVGKLAPGSRGGVGALRGATAGAPEAIARASPGAGGRGEVGPGRGPWDDAGSGASGLRPRGFLQGPRLRWREG